jgi:hypothetical protein
LARRIFNRAFSRNVILLLNWIKDRKTYTPLQHYTDTQFKVIAVRYSKGCANLVVAKRAVVDVFFYIHGQPAMGYEP